MNIKAIEEAYRTEDAIKRANEAERIAYVNNELEIAKAYALIAELLEYKLSVKEAEQ
jgi:hypothetical protein